MANDDVYRAGMAEYEGLIEQEWANYRQAVRNNDDEGQKRAWQSVAAWRVQMREAQAIAMEADAASRPQPASPMRNGVFTIDDKEVEALAARLNDRQIEAAAISGISEKEYARNVAKYQYLKSIGEIG